MHKQAMPSLEVVRALFELDPATGALIFKDPHRLAGRRAGTTNTRRRMVSVSGRMFQADKIVWLLAYGSPPERVVHLDGDDWNDAVGNLAATALVVDGKRPVRPRSPR